MRIVSLLLSGDIHIALKRLTFAVSVLALSAALLLTAGLIPYRALANSRAGCSRTSEESSEATLHHLRTSVLCLVNLTRERYGLVPLHHNPDLRRSATGHSNDMVAEDYFSHEGPRGSTLGGRVARAGYLTGASSYFLGEDIGWGRGRRYGSPLGILRSWMHRPSRANILDPRFRDFGVGVARGFPGAPGADAITYTLVLATRR